MFKRSFLAVLLLTGQAFAQSPGTVVLHGPSFNPALPQVTPEATAAAVNSALTSKVDVNNGALGGVPTAPTAAPGTNTTQLATTAFVRANPGGVASFNTRTGAISLLSTDVTGALSFTPYNATNPTGYQTSAQVATAVGTETTRAMAAEALLSPKASPTFTGVPAVPTASPGANTTQAASTAFVTAAVVASTTGVASVNTRTGAVVINSTDVTTGLGYTPLNIVGTATNDNASAGNIGEFKSTDVVAGSAVSLTSGSPANIATLSLTAGDWDVWGTVRYTPGVATVTTVSSAWASQTSATAPATSNGGGITVAVSPGQAGLAPAMSAGYQRISLAGTTTIYLTTVTTFAGGTLVGYGFIGARRAR